MLRPFDDYHWQDHLPALGRIDLAVCILVGLALPAFAVWDRPSEGRGPRDSIADEPVVTAPPVGGQPVAYCHDWLAVSPRQGAVKPKREDV